MNDASRTSGSDETIERDLLALVASLLHEVRPHRAGAAQVLLSSRIERDLGIDSLGRTELILRVERAFRVRLPVRLVAEAETVGDILAALQQAEPHRLPATGEAARPALPPVPAAADARTLVEMVDWHVARHPDRLHVTLLQDDATVLGALTYGELAQAARAVAAGLIARDIVPGDRVALMLPTSLDFFAAFLGILYAGAVPVPIYPPMRLSQLEDHLRRQAGILRNAGARMLVTVPEGLRLGALLRALVDSVQTLESVAALASARADVPLPKTADGAATAFLQYTSGSTGDPKGVVLSHANLLANVRAMGAAMEATSADIFVSWLPLYHDMGLIGAWIGCLHFAAPLYLMPPVSFLVRPQSWLWSIHRFRATLSASPNFGFELCLNKIDDADLAGLDLSSLRMVANGAEPVSPDTIRRFAERFGRYGFRPQAMAPVYGLAEDAVGLAFPPPGRGPVIDRVNRAALSRRGVAEPAAPDDRTALELVACGQPLAGHEIRIVDELGHELGERREGRLEFRGPSATSGYFRNEAKTRELIRDGWLDSGDRAYVAGGDVFITGRVKDIIIRAGQHIYPQEVEEAVGDVEGIRKGCVAVFGVTDPASGTERLIVLAETRETEAAAREQVRARANDAAAAALGTPPDEVVLAAPRTVPKTSSGKLRRGAAKALYLGGQLGAAPPAPWRQILHLSLAGLGPELSRGPRLAGAALYAAWWWIVLGLGALVGASAVMLLPQLRWRWSALRRTARLVLAAQLIPVRVVGVERIPARGAMLVFNHSSYMDVLVLAAALPGEPAFVAKKELAGQLFAGPLLRRLGALFVERFDVAGSLADAETVTASARQGRVLVFFPEGTFTRRAGLSGFYLGAFKIASEAGLPVFPGAIRGTRTILRGDQWFPRHGAVSMQVHDGVRPDGTDFHAAVQLRDAVRATVLAGCGEPDLVELIKPTPSPR